MEQYIPKAAVLAEIDRMFDKHSSKHDIDEAGVVLLQLRENVESLETKEVDFKPMDDNFERDAVQFCFDNALNTTPRIARTIAKHFFELGVNASNPLTWEDIKLIWNITDEMDNMPEEEFYKEVLKRFKAQKGE